MNLPKYRIPTTKYQLIPRPSSLLSRTSFLLTLLYLLLGKFNTIHASTNPFTFQRPTNFSITNIGIFISAVLQLLFIIGGILVFIYFIWGGLQWLTAGGDKAATQAARERITGALIGFSLMAISLAIVYIAQAFFGIKIIGPGIMPRGF